MKSQKEIIEMMARFNASSDVARNSKFYNQIMADGNIFNPYLHRRFLPVQFQRLIDGAAWERGGCGEVDVWKYTKKSYDNDYIYNFLLEEMRKLAIMEKRDKLAFEERRLFFPLEDMKSYILEYVDSVYSDIKAKSSVYYEKQKYQLIKDDHDTKFKVRIDDAYKLITSLNTCTTYAEAAELIEKVTINFASFKIITQISGTVLDKFFKNYLKSGAYYFLKHYIMFSDNYRKFASSFEGATSEIDMIDFINNQLVSGKDWTYFYSLILHNDADMDMLLF